MSRTTCIPFDLIFDVYSLFLHVNAHKKQTKNCCSDICKEYVIEKLTHLLSVESLLNRRILKSSV